MKRYAFLLLVVTAALLVSGCSRDNTTAPTQSAATDQAQNVIVNPEAVAAELVARAGWVVESDDATGTKGGGPAHSGGGGLVIAMNREVVMDDIVHYYFEVQVGSGPYDVIGIHRVVREGKKCKPIRSKKSIFLLHGDGVGFTKFMFGVDSPNTPDELSAAVYLAQGNVDVWGIDQNWVLVPPSTTDFGFMAGWDMQNQIDNLWIGIAVARCARLATGNGWRKMHLLGYSSGVLTGYAYLNQETQLPPGHRQVAGWIPVDAPYKTDFEPTHQVICAAALDMQAAIDAGVYQDETPGLMQLFGMLGSMDPDSPSPIIPGLTNLQASLFFGSVTYQLFPYTPWFHYEAGTFDEYGLPTGLQYTTTPGWNDFLMSACTFEAYAFELDYAKIMCGDYDVPYDDYLGEITNPILLLEAGGSLGGLGMYTAQLTASSDITELIISLHPPEEKLLDYGHIDLWTADNAPQLAWQPLLKWVNDHTPGEGNFASYRKK